MIGYADAPMGQVRVGLIGLGNRGQAAYERYANIPGAVIAAVCDCDSDRVLPDMHLVRVYGGVDGWRELCSDPTIDLVYICTDWLSHADIACYAMECGKHVAVEVPAATSVEECRRLVHTAETYRRHCMMLENCIYDLFEASTFNMVRAGLFGEIYHAEGGYIHNLQYLAEWREQFNKDRVGDNYPTHGFGPLCRLLDIHRADYLLDITSFRTPTPDGGHIISVIRTKKGKSIILQHNISAARPYTRLYQFTGTKGFASKYPSPAMAFLPDADTWLTENEVASLIETYRPEYYEAVRALMPEAADQRRYMDYAMDYRLIHCLQNGLPLDMDVYDAAEWSCISELSHISIENGSIPVSFPNFFE